MILLPLLHRLFALRLCANIRQRSYSQGTSPQTEKASSVYPLQFVALHACLRPPFPPSVQPNFRKYVLTQSKV